MIHQGELVDVIRLTIILFNSNKNSGEKSPHLVSEFLLLNEQKKENPFSARVLFSEEIGYVLKSLESSDDY